jgi:3-hydroxy-9,10-secoandrosta-1,3,5(10)-triene-9,17-dione monooxygenase reductase component
MIHHVDPFATPEPDRSPVRRLRGRLVAPVTLWTAYGAQVDRLEDQASGRGQRVALTVSSLLVADGEPGRILGLVDDESDLFAALTATGQFAVCPLAAGEQAVADQFAGLAPMVSDVTWIDTEYGPVLAGDRSWVGCRLEASRPFGWGQLVEATIAEVTIGADDTAPLAHHRGRYRTLPPAAPHSG